MLRPERGYVFQISDGARDFKNPVVSAGAESLLRHRPLDQALAVSGEFAESANVARAHLGVAIEFLSRRGEALQLLLASSHHALTNLGRSLGLRARTHLLVIDRRPIDMDVEPAHKRASDLRGLALDHGQRALAS